MIDTLTILRSRWRRLAKLIEAPDRIASYEDARTFDAAEIEVRDLSHLADIVRALVARPDCCAVRGALIGAPRQRRIRRLLHNQDDHPATLRDVPRHWLAIDVEGIDLPQDVPAADLAGCAAVALHHLPAAFTGAATIVQATGSHGLKPDMRLRLWFWLDRPTAGDELKRWLRNTPADPSIFSAAQAIYTAAPVFAGGMRDHLPARIVTLPGAPVVAVPDPAILAPPPPREMTEAVIFPRHADRYMRAALARAAQRIASAGKRHPTIISETCGLARFVHAGLLAERDLAAVITSAARAAGKDDDAEINSMIAWGLAHPSAAALPEIQHRGR